MTNHHQADARTSTWLDPRAKLVFNKHLATDQYGVALLTGDGSWNTIDWGLTLPMAVRLLKLLHTGGTYDHRRYTIDQDHRPRTTGRNPHQLPEKGAMNDSTIPIPSRILQNCGTCRFWSAQHNDPAQGDCQLANGTMSTGDDGPALMQIEILAETIYDFATAFDPDAVLNTARAFRCSHWDILGTLDSPENPADAELTLGERLRKARLARGLSHTQLSQLIGEDIIPEDLHRVEGNNAALKTSQLARAAVATGVTSDHLLGIENTETHDP